VRILKEPAYDPKSGMYRGKGNGVDPTRVPRSPAVKIGGRVRVHPASRPSGNGHGESSGQG
jgi:hypothetical protein